MSDITDLKIKKLTKAKENLNNKISRQNSKIDDTSKDDTLPKPGNKRLFYSKTGKTYSLPDRKINVVL